MTSPIILTWPVPQTAYFCATQSMTSGTPLTFAPPISSPTTTVQSIQNIFTGALTYSASMPSDNVRSVSFTSSGNASAVTFTITGDDGYGNPITTTRTGPNATTVYTSVTFGNIYSITPSYSGTVSATISVGTGPAGNTRWVPTDLFNKAAVYAFTYEVSGTVYLTPVYVPYFTTFVNGQANHNNLLGVLPITFESGRNIYVSSSSLAIPITATCSFQTNSIIMGAFSTSVSSTTGSFSSTIVQQGAKF